MKSIHFIQLRDEDEEPYTIRIEAISYICKTPNGRTKISMNNGDSIYVKSTYDELVAFMMKD